MSFWRIDSFFRTLIAVVVTILWTSFLMLITFAGLPRSLRSYVIRGWSVLVAWFFAIEVVVDGKQNYHREKPYLVICNHQSLLDVVVSYIALDGHLRMVSKKEILWIPFFGWSVRMNDFISVDRSAKNSNGAVTKRLKDRFSKGLQMWIAPEGTRSKDGQLQRFRTGAFAVATDAGVPILPLVIHDAYKVLAKKDLLIHPRTKIHVTILPEISTEGFTSDDRAKLAEKAHGLFADALKAQH